MIGYVDTSAFVPLLVAEPGSAICRRFWEEADALVSCRLLYVETAAALAQAARLARIHEQHRVVAIKTLDQLWDSLDVIDIDDDLVRDAAALAHEHGLRGYDAVHCASACLLDADDLVAATGDRQLLSAWAELGLATLDTSG